jgi:hypothetical protein
MLLRNYFVTLCTFGLIQCDLPCFGLAQFLRFRQSDLCVLLDFDRYLDNLSQLVRFAYMAFFLCEGFSKRCQRHLGWKRAPG